MNTTLELAPLSGKEYVVLGDGCYPPGAWLSFTIVPGNLVELVNSDHTIDSVRMYIYNGKIGDAYVFQAQSDGTILHLTYDQVIERRLSSEDEKARFWIKAFEYLSRVWARFIN